MARHVGLHTIPGLTRETLAGATPALERATVAQVYQDLGFPYDSIHEIEAIRDNRDNGGSGTETRYL